MTLRGFSEFVKWEKLMDDDNSVNQVRVRRNQSGQH